MAKRSRASVLGAAVLAAMLSSTVAAEVYRCTEAGKTVYSDKPCGADAAKVPIRIDGPGASRHRSPLGAPGTKLTVSDAVRKDCFDRYRALTRDPTTIKTLYSRAEIAPNGFPFVETVVVLTNKLGGPERTGFYCRLTDELIIDEEVTKTETRQFFEQQLK